MEVKTGYKQTEVGVIPEEWEVKTLSAISSMKSGETITASRITEHSQYPCYGGNGLRGFTSQYTHSGSFAIIGRQGALCGNVIGVTGMFFASEHAVVVTPLEDTNIKFLTYALGEMRLNRLSEASAQPGLSVSKILQLRIGVPRSKNEQHAIAEALSDVDELLGGLDRLIAKKRDLKQATMQQLLTSQTRLSGFSGEWREIRLGSIADVLKGNALSKSLTTTSGTHQCILYGELFTTYGRVISDVFSLTNSSDGCPSIQGDVLMPGSTTTTGIDLATASVLLMDNVALGGDIIIIRRKDNDYAPVFLANYLTQARRHEIAELTQGITIHHLYGKDLKTLMLKLPSFPEQTAIAEVLTDMDAELAALEQRREKTRALKQAMMQELLTGRTRLI